MNRIAGLAALIVTTVLCANSSAIAWTPPIGIPAPTFGINEVAPAVPNPWTTPTAGFYYVNWSASNATDSGNVYGTPSLPRKTIPRSLPAGAVVELHGTYDQSHSSPENIVASGTLARPVFIRGSTAAARPKITQSWELSGSYYILETLEFADRDGIGAGRVRLLAPTSFAALRDSDVHGNLNSGGVIVASFNTSVTTQVVIYKNLIHDNGDVNATFDQDVHGIAVSARVNNLWILDNEFYGNSGDGVQINAGDLGSQPTTHHIYLGRNVSHHNKQSGLMTKQAADVIFSQNHVYAHRPGNSSGGGCMGFQYAPERVWFLFNYIHDCDYGIATGSNSGLGSGTESYYVGNVIHNIHHSGAYSPGSAWSSAGMTLVGGLNRYVVHNTIFDVDAGINSPGGGKLQITNNIIASVTEAQGNHIFIEDGTTASASTMHHNLFDGTVRVRWGSGTVYSLSEFQAAFPEKGLNSLNASPLFVDALNRDFRLQGASLAVDAGMLDNVYATFASLYGIDIVKDITGVPRPQGLNYDLGAYEFTTLGEVPAAPSQLQVR